MFGWFKKKEKINKKVETDEQDGDRLLFLFGTQPEKYVEQYQVYIGDNNHYFLKYTKANGVVVDIYWIYQADYNQLVEAYHEGKEGEVKIAFKILAGVIFSRRNTASQRKYSNR